MKLVARHQLCDENVPLCFYRLSLTPRLRSSTPAASYRLLCRADKQELLVCVNKTCKKQGSVPVAQFAEDISACVEDFHVERTGCQGKCGNGPNMRLEPDGLDVSHMGTPAKVAQLLRDVCNMDVSPALLKATELRAAGVAEARINNLPAAIDLFTGALSANPPQGAHLILANRSAAYRSIGKYREAAADADEAVKFAPKGFSTAYIRQVEAYSALEDYRTAMAALEQAAKQDRGFGTSRDFQKAKQQLQPLLKKSKPFRR